MFIKWRYLSQNQKIGIGFSIVIVILLLVNGLLAMQYSSKSKEIKQNTDQALNSINKANLDSKYEKPQVDTKNLQNIDTKSSFTSLQSRTIASDIDSSIEFIDSSLGLADQNIDLSNLTK